MTVCITVSIYTCTHIRVRACVHMIGFAIDRIFFSSCFLLLAGALSLSYTLAQFFCRGSVLETPEPGTVVVFERVFMLERHYKNEQILQAFVPSCLISCSLLSKGQ